MQFNAPCTTGMLLFFYDHDTFASHHPRMLIYIFLIMQAVCLAACKKLHEMGAFTDMLLPDKGSGEEKEQVDQTDEGDPLPGTARHREFYPEGVANILQVRSFRMPYALDYLC